MTCSLRASCSGNVHVGQMSHAGVDRIGHALAVHQVVHHGARALNRRARLRLQQHRPALANYLPQIFQSQIVAVDVKCVHIPQCATDELMRTVVRDVDVAGNELPTLAKEWPEWGTPGVNELVI